MTLTIANISTSITDTQLQSAVAAISRQVAEHFQPEWSITAALVGSTAPLGGQAPIQGNQNAIIYMGDSPQDPTTGVSGLLGYHAQTNAGIPYGFVYFDICTEYGETWTTTLSHEVLELLADPDAAMTVTGPSPQGDGSVYYDLEVCDPTQGDAYPIDNIDVCNFVGRSYFGLTGGSGRSNWLDLPLAVFGVRPGGYVQYEDGTGAHQIKGEKVTDRQLAAKRLMKTGRRNERRRERLKRKEEKRFTRAGSGLR